MEWKESEDLDEDLGRLESDCIPERPHPLNTGLMWVKDRGEKLTWDEAMAGVATCRAGGHSDWRVPTIKELYSLIDFRGGCDGRESSSRPYIDTRTFEFAYGDASHGERIIDCQDWSATEYLGTTMGRNATVFGVNFADGRIKGYPKMMRRREGLTVKKLHVRYVRGNPAYVKTASATTAMAPSRIAQPV